MRLDVYLPVHVVAGIGGWSAAVLLTAAAAVAAVDAGRDLEQLFQLAIAGRP